MAEKSQSSTLPIVSTPEQQEPVRPLAGKKAEVRKLALEQLEERLAPRRGFDW